MNYQPEWTYDVLARIRVYHGAQDTGAGATKAWTDALTYAGVTSLDDAIHAVVRHYTTPGANRWITPGDVVAGIRAIRDDRLDRTELPVPNVDPDDPRAGNDEIRALRSAIADGVFDADTYRRGNVTLSGHPARRQLTTVRVLKSRAIDAAAQTAFHAIPVPDIPAIVSTTAAAAQETSRSRQLAALVAAYGPAVAAGAPPPPGPEGTR